MDLFARLSTALAGRYELLCEIGRGGMSEVFLARDLRLDREVALKALRPELTQSIGAERFEREIQLVSHFEHLHLLQLYESGTADGVLYYVMPYARDGSLRDRLRRELQLGLDAIVRIATEVAEGLEHAHRRGVVHRDIKPENIFFVDGHAVVADFGIAHAYSEAGGETFTETGIAIGTPQYMSPEQAAGERRIDHRSDIYALGCVVYEMLSGGPPFEGPTVQAILAKHIAERVPSLRVVRSGIPARMAAAVEKALEKVPADRFESATDFAAALAQGRETAPDRGARTVRESLVQILTTPWVIAVVAVVAAAAAGIPLARGLFADKVEPSFEGRPASVLVLPYRTGTSSEREIGLAADVASRITRELNSWDSTRAVTSVELSRPMLDLRLSGPALERVDDGIALAKAVGVQALATLTLTLQGDSAYAEAVLYDPATEQPVGEPFHAHGVASEPARLVSPLASTLLGFRGAAVDLEALRRRSSNPDALRADIQGLSGLEHWRLDEAERHFRRAIALDSTFAMAELHLAQTLYWHGVQGTRSSTAVQPEIAERSAAAVRHASALTATDSLLIHAFQRIQNGDFADVARGRELLRALLRLDPGNPHARLMLASAEVADPWLGRKPDGSLAPRSDLNFAVRTFTELLRGETGFELGYGQLRQIYEEIAATARGEGCRGFERPRSDVLVGWEELTPRQMLFFCPVALDSIVWRTYGRWDSVARSAARAGADRLVGEWTRLLRWWASTAPQASKPRMELAAVALGERERRPAPPPERIDSLTRAALRFTAEALGLRSDTLPDDLVRLGALYLGAGDIDSALLLTERGVSAGGGLTPDALAANVFMATGQPSRAMVVAASWENQLYIPDPVTGGQIAYGGGDRIVDRLGVLGAAGVDGPTLRGELRALDRAWSPPEYSKRERQLLREDAAFRVAVALSHDSAALREWSSGLEISQPLWRALTLGAADSAEARARFDEALQRRIPRLGETERHFLLAVVAGRLGDHRRAAGLFTRLDSVALSVTALDTRWGLKSLSYLLRADEYAASGEPDSAQAYYRRFTSVWKNADSLAKPLGERARRGLGSVQRNR